MRRLRLLSNGMPGFLSASPAWFAQSCCCDLQTAMSKLKEGRSWNLRKRSRERLGPCFLRLSSTSQMLSIAALTKYLLRPAEKRRGCQGGRGSRWSERTSKLSYRNYSILRNELVPKLTRNIISLVACPI